MPRLLPSLTFQLLRLLFSQVRLLFEALDTLLKPLLYLQELL